MTRRMTAEEYRAQVKSPGRKYRNEPIVIDGFRFDSKKESRRYGELLIRERAGEIENLVLQPRFPIEIAGILVCTYVADFQYLDRQTGDTVVEDVKSPASRTRAYLIKRKLMRAVHGIEIMEIG